MMKKLATIALTTALAASTIEVPTAFAETAVATDASTLEDAPYQLHLNYVA